MSMSNRGLTKLVEECGELVQVAAKRIAYPHAFQHPDGTILQARMMDEIADVQAALLFVKEKFEVDKAYVNERTSRKLALFKKWDKEVEDEPF